MDSKDPVNKNVTEEQQKAIAAAEEEQKSTVATEEEQKATVATEEEQKPTAATEEEKKASAATDEEQKASAATDEEPKASAATEEERKASAVTEEEQNASTEGVRKSTVETEKLGGEETQRRRKRQGSAKDGKKEKDKKFKKKTEKEEEKLKHQVKEEKFVEPNYNSSRFFSKPFYSHDSSVPHEILKFYHSYGYDSTRRNNLQMLDSDTLAFINGNYIHFYSVKESKLKSLRRSALGNGLGHLCVHPSRQHFAVGEKGSNPSIIVYTWPKLKVYRILRRSTTRGYAFVNFNPAGNLVCSQGLDPDYMLTIWDWAKEKIVLRCKAFSQDVFQATFSPSNPGDLTTCGVGHIRFWRMAETFTGLKLQGAIGRFGKTEISDIQGYTSLSAGKVISGCEWGNMLIWDGGLIVVELVQPAGKTCHNGEVTVMFVQETGELLTVGKDGYLKLWECDTIEIADTIVDDTGKFEIEPIHELKLSSLAQPVSAIKAVGASENIWYIQDSWGKIWNVNLTKSLANHEYKAETVFYNPGGGINAVATSPTDTIMVIGTTEGHLWLIEYIKKECIARKSYEQAITKLLWLPTRYDPSGTTFLAGFKDGNLRVLQVCKKSDKERKAPTGDIGVGDDEEYKLPFKFHLLDRLRVHKGAMTVLKLDEEEDIIYCCGEDRLIFTLSVYWDDETKSVALYPLSFVTAPFPVCSLDLHPNKAYRIVIASTGGRVAECRKPEWGELDTKISYNQGKLHGRRWWYTSVKSHQRREERRTARKAERDKKYAHLLKDIKARKEAGVLVEEEMEISRLNDFYRRAQQLDDDEPLYIPEKPCPILAIYYQMNTNIIVDPSVGRSFFIHTGGYDAGYIYECNCLRPKAAGFHTVPLSPTFKEDVAIHSFTISVDDDYLILGMGDGSIRVVAQFDVYLKEEREQRRKEEERESITDEEESEDSENEAEPISPDQIGFGVDAKKSQKKKLPPFVPSILPYDLEDFMSIPMHDPDRGAVNDLAWSFDHQFLFSVGADGSIFAYRWDENGILKKATDNLPKPSVPKNRAPGPQEPDTENPLSLTLEERKKKDEDDRLFFLAEEKKEVIRKQLKKMKIHFQKLKITNNNIPEKYRLPRECFRLDPRIYAPFQEQRKQALEMVYKKLEYDAAQSILMTEKIEKNFFDEIETPHIIVKDICHTIQVHTIRNRYLTKEFHEILTKNKLLMIKEASMLQEDDKVEVMEEKKVLPSVNRVYAVDLIGEYEGKKYNINTIHTIRNLERRLEKRYKREIIWRDLEYQKIPDNYVPPEDILALKIAKATTGDYKLKTSSDYLGEQITASARRQRVLDLKEEMYALISTFNKNVVDLRDEKHSVIKVCRKLEANLKEVRKNIPKDLRKPIPPIFDMQVAEKPELKFKITAKDIADREKKKLMETGLWDKKDQIMNEVLGKAKPVDFTKRLVPRNKRKEKPKRPPFRKPMVNTQTTRGGRVEVLEDESRSTHKYRKCVFNPKTALGEQRYGVLISRRCFEQDTLLEKLHSVIEYYRNRVRFLRDERVTLQLDLKMMSLRLMNMIAELQIVKDFESEEKAIVDRLRSQQVECSAAKDRFERSKNKLNAAKVEMQKFDEKIAVLQKEAGVVIAEKPKHADYLWKVFKKKVHVDNGEEVPGGDGEGVGSGSSESGSSKSTSQDSNSDMFKLPKQKMDVNICPDSLDKDMYNRICELREKKAQLELEIESKKKVVEHIMRESEEIENVYLKYEGRLSDIGQEVAIVQHKKQGRMNELMVLCILKADQIQCLEEDEIDHHRGAFVHRIRKSFPSLDELIIFPKNGIAKLERRAEELKDESAFERDRLRKTMHMLGRLQEELKRKELSVGAKASELREEMMLKFGQIVDLDHLSAAVINLELLDLQIKVEQARNQQYHEKYVTLKNLEKEKTKLTEITKDNSDCNVLMAKVIERQRDVDYFLHKKSKKENEDNVGALIKGRSIYTVHVTTKEDDDIMTELEKVEKLTSKLRNRLTYLRQTISAFQHKDGIPDKPSLEEIPETRNMLMQVQAIQAKYNTELQYLYTGCADKGTPAESKKNVSPVSPEWLNDVSSAPDEYKSSEEFTEERYEEVEGEGEEDNREIQLDGARPKYELEEANQDLEDDEKQMDLDDALNFISSLLEVSNLPANKENSQTNLNEMVKTAEEEEE